MDENGNTVNGSGSSIGHEAERVVRHARAIGKEVSGLAEAVSGIAQAAKSRIDLERRMREEPVRTLIIAAGVGYVAGGGFFTPFTGKLLRVGARLWLIPTLKRQLMTQE